MMDELLKGLARILCVRGERRHKFLADKGLPCHDCGKQEDALRDAGLGELLEAGQAEHQNHCYECCATDLEGNEHLPTCKAYVYAEARVRAVLAGAEKGRAGE